MIRLAAPAFLALLPLVLISAAWMARRRHRGDARLALPRAAAGLRLGTSPWTVLDRTLPWIRAAALVALVVALARPQTGTRVENVSTLGVDIVVALDVSDSMRAEDFAPQNRLTVAKQTVGRFVAGRPSDRIGLVSFAALATTRCPLTTDHEMLGQFLEQIDFAPKNASGTAIGLGLATAVNRLRDSDARSRVVVLVTDGKNNRGQIGPEAAAEAARALGIKVYTVGVGREGVVPVPFDFGGRIGTRVIRQELELDEELLQEIARTTSGQYFRATDPDGLQAVFETIDALEKSRIENKVRFVYSEMFAWVLVPGLVLLALERLLSLTRLRRIP